MLAPRQRLALFLTALVLTFAVGLWWRTPRQTASHPVEVKADAAAAGPALEADDDVTPIAGELLVDVKSASLPAMERDLQAAIPGEKVDVGEWSHMDDEVMARVEVPAGREDQAVALLQREAGVDSVDRDYLMHAYGRPQGEPNDPLYPYLWNMRKVGAMGAWRGSTGKGTVVAVIDTGVAYEDYKQFHRVEDMKAETFVPGYNALNHSEHANDDHAHGTHVAATIAEDTNNSLGAIGLAYDAQIMPIKVLSGSGSGSIGTICDGIVFAADHHANVINMSLGGPMGTGALKQACAYAYRKGVCIVCAAGNAGSNNVGYPAFYPQCIAVSAVRDDNTLSWYSNRGRRIDIAAPGGDLTVDQNNDGYLDGILQNTIERQDPSKEGYFLFQGTSMASPHVAAAAALVEALGITNPDAVKAILQRSASRKDIPDLTKGFGAGVLDANTAVFQAIVYTGAAQLTLGLVLMILALRLAKGGDYAHLTPFTLIGVLFTASGLFFLPYVTNAEIPYADFLCRPIAAWDIHLLGLPAHANPLFYSALLPMGLALLFNRRLIIMQQLMTGFNAGYAACLLHLALTDQAKLHWIPSFLALPSIWLVLNAALCMFVAVGLADARHPRKG